MEAENNHVRIKPVRLVQIKLTDEQIKELQPLFDYAMDATIAGKPVIVMTQAFGLDESFAKAGKLVFGIVPFEICQEMKALVEKAK